MERRVDMHDICTYELEIQGRIDKSTLNANSPLQMTMTEADADQNLSPAATRFSVRADQSGLIGLIRHLHGHGFVLLSIIRTK